MPNRILIFILVLFICAEQSVNSADKSMLDAHVKFLSDDALEGRLPGTDGNIKAAEYIKNYFLEYGVKPLGSDFYDKFEITTGLELGNGNSCYFETIVQKPGVPKEMLRPVKKEWKLGEDWHPIRFSDKKTVTGELAFVGFGISSEELKYDDYKDIDVKDKIVIVLTDSSENSPADKDFFGRYSSLGFKATNARNHGAIGVIFIKTMSDSANNWYPFEPERMYTNAGIVVMQANRTSLAKFFPTKMPMLDLEKEIKATRNPKSFILPNVTITVSTEIKEIKTTVANVVGFIEGTDPKLKEEYIVVGAHFDHLGWGGYNSLYKGKTPQIHNGADDNSSGTSAMIEIAKSLAQDPTRRSVIFMGFNAEEIGLLGSAEYVNNPIVPLEKTVFMLNLDMVGRMKDDKVSILGVGTSSVFEGIIDSIASIEAISPSKVNAGYGPSDHASFYSKDIPVIMLFTELHGDYHRPTDDYEKINFDGLGKVTDFAEKIVRTIGNSDRKPDYIIVETMDSTQKTMRHKGYGAWFGIIPNFEDTPLGMKISGASAGSPAQKAGLQSNDIIIKFDGKRIKNLYEMTFILKEKHPGDKVEVVFQRDGNEKMVVVQLEERK